MQKQTIYIGSDHGGFEQKHNLIVWLEKNGYKVNDLGPELLDPKDDYPDFAFAVAQAVQKANQTQSVAQDPVAFGILTCRSAAGMTIAANKVAGVRAVAVTDDRSAVHARQHNNANILALSGDWLTELEMRKLTESFISTAFSSEERHVRRLEKITHFESTRN